MHVVNQNNGVNKQKLTQSIMNHNNNNNDRDEVILGFCDGTSKR